MEQLKAILVDDELNSLQNLQQKLVEFCPDVEILAATQKPEEAIRLVRELKPDLLFLDIEMPRMNGFRMLEEIEDITFEIIFTTAYNHYAVDAIRISAFDYLTKPIAIGDLQHAVERLSKQKQLQTRDKLGLLRQSLHNSKSQDEKIAIPTGEGLEFIPIHSILYIESSSNYSKLFLQGGKNILVTKLLKDFEDMLVPYRFYRIHNSHLINLRYIEKYIKGEGGQVRLSNGTVLDVSRRKKEEFIKLITG
ncbi:MAG: LytTR family DNA-binding domain-containing protein [Ferruginibacter sp.]